MLDMHYPGVFAAALTPRRRGRVADEPALGPYVDFLAAGGVDGLLVCGTTGEGILLSVEERQRAAGFSSRRLEKHGLPVAVHCGAQTTADTAALAAHAAESGASAVAVIAPPYFALDERALEAHLAAAAAACAPLPFYVYEFEARAGYPVPVPLIERLRARARRTSAASRSQTGREGGRAVPARRSRRVRRGRVARHARSRDAAAGAVSGLASSTGGRRRTRARAHHGALPGGGAAGAQLERFPFHAAAKIVAARRGAPIGPDVRAPLRRLTQDELGELTRSHSVIVVAGAGAIGASVAYNLALLGARAVVLCDRGEVGGGSTAKAMGGVGSSFRRLPRCGSRSSRSVFSRSWTTVLRPGRLPARRRPARTVDRLERRLWRAARARWACPRSARAYRRPCPLRRRARRRRLLEGRRCRSARSDA